MNISRECKMSNTKKLLVAVAMMSVSSASASLSFAQGEDAADSISARKEKCYGIVKAGKNDCAAADGTHSCAGLAKNDASGNEWVLLPVNTCERIVGASLSPKG